MRRRTDSAELATVSSMWRCTASEVAHLNSAGDHLGPIEAAIEASTRGGLELPQYREGLLHDHVTGGEVLAIDG